MAIAKPPKVNVLIEIPNILKMIAVIINDNGMAVSVMMVVLKFNKNKKRMITIRIKPSLNASSTLVREWTIKSFCLNTFV